MRSELGDAVMRKSIIVSVLLIIVTAFVLTYILLTPETLLTINISECSSFSLVASNADLLTDNNEIHINSVSAKVDNERDALELLGEYGFSKNELAYEGCFESQYMLSYCFSQYFELVPVIGNFTKVITDTDGRVIEITSNYTDVSEVNTEPMISAENAASIVCDLEGDNSIISCRLAIYTGNLQPILSYEVITNSDCIYIIDAADGTIICSDTIYSLANVQANGQLSKVSVDIQYSPETAEYIFTNEQKNISLFIADNDLEDFGIDFNKPFSVAEDSVSDGCPKSAVDAYYNICRVYDYYSEVLGHVSTDGNGETEIYVTDNLGMKKSNGQWVDFIDNAMSSSFVSENQKYSAISVARSSTDKTFSCNIDVMAHEYTHAVIYWLLGGSDFNNSQGDGINEAVSDVLGECCQSYCENSTIDWIVGGKRNLAEPQGAFPIPDYTKYSDSLDPHDSSALASYTAYLMSKGIYNGTVTKSSSLKFNNIYAINDSRLISKLWYNSLFFMTPSSDFTSFRYALERSADIMLKNGDLSEKQYKSVCAALEAVKIPEYAIGENTEIIVMDENSEPLDAYWLSIIDEGLWGVSGNSEIIYNGLYENSIIDKTRFKWGHNYTINVRGLLSSMNNIATLRFNYKKKGDNRFEFRTEYVFSPVSASQGKLTGKVCKAADKETPIPNAKIVVYSDDAPYDTGKTENDGQYSFDLPEGEYKVEISAEGYISFSSNEVVSPEVTTYSETYLMVNGSETETGSAHGFVYNALSGEGMADVRLDVYDNWNNTSSEIIKTISTKNDGSYTLELPLGNYTVKASYPECIDSTTNIVVDKTNGTNQNITISPFISEDTFRIVLKWDENPRDLDSHMIGYLRDGNTFHTFFSNLESYDDNITVCKLDHDDTQGNGFETITLTPTTSAPYTYYVHRYAGSGTITGSGAKVEVYQGNSQKPIATFNAPVDQGSGDYWNLFTLENGDISINDVITNSSPKIDGEALSDEIVEMGPATTEDDNSAEIIQGIDPDSQYYADALVNSQITKPTMDYRNGWMNTNLTIPIEVSKVLRRQEDGRLIIPFLGTDMFDDVSDRDIKVSGIECNVNGPFSFSISNANEDGTIISYVDSVPLDFNNDFVMNVELYLDPCFVPSEIKHEYTMSVKVHTNIGVLMQEYKILVRNMDLYYQTIMDSEETSEEYNNSQYEEDDSREYKKSKYMKNQLDKALEMINETSFVGDNVFSQYFVNDDNYDLIMKTVIMWRGFVESDCAKNTLDFGRNDEVLKISNVRVKSGTGRKSKTALADIYFTYEKYYDADVWKSIFSLFGLNNGELNGVAHSYSFYKICYRIDYKASYYEDVNGVLELHASYGNIDKTRQVLTNVLNEKYEEQINSFFDEVCGLAIEELDMTDSFKGILKYAIKTSLKFKDIKGLGEDIKSYHDAKVYYDSISIE